VRGCHPGGRIACAPVFAPRKSHLLVLLAVAAAFALGALLPSAFGRSKAAPGAVRDALAQTSHVRGAPQRTLVLSRVVIDPGAKLPLHHHEGTQVARVLAGTLSYTVRRGAAAVRSGEADASPRLVRRIEAGQTARLQPGQWIVEQPTDIHEAANLGGVPVVIYLATLLRTGAPPSTAVELNGRENG
jgi:mannose-6-phosphate isomerase-like protein (cupin superfamily)